MCRSTNVARKSDQLASKAPEDAEGYAILSTRTDVDGKNSPIDAMCLAQQKLQSGTFLSCISLLFLITGASLTFPHMQSRRDALACDSLCYGSMTSVRGALGLIGTTLMGRLSDKNESFLAQTLGTIGVTGISTPVSSGRRACLYIGTIASLLGFAIAASIDSLSGLWLSMIPGALLQHNFDMFKALVSEYHNDIDYIESTTNDNKTDDPDNKKTIESSTSRSGSVGKLGMTVGIAFMIGPMVAAILSPSFQLATYMAIACTIASGIVIYRVPLPVSAIASVSQQYTSDKEGVAGKNFSLLNMIKLQNPVSRAAMTLLVIRLNMALAFHIFNTIWPSSLKARFQFGPADHARFMSFVGVTYAFSQGFLAKRVIKVCGPNGGKVYAIMTCCAILGFGRYVAYYTQRLAVMYASFLFIINALGIMNTVITADTGRLAPSNELGGLFGILQSAESAAGMFGPFLGGVISHYFGDLNNISAPLMAVVCIYGFLFAFIFWGYDKLVLSCAGASRNLSTSEITTKKSM